jgi:hypothetical protein
MKIVASVLLNSGLELLGSLEDFTSLPAFTEDGTALFANDDEGQLFQFDRFWLYKPLRVVSLPSQQGLANVLMPTMQMTEIQAPQTVLRIMADDVLCITTPKPDVEAQYTQAMSGIAVPPGAGKFSLVKP